MKAQSIKNVLYLHMLNVSALGILCLQTSVLVLALNIKLVIFM